MTPPAPPVLHVTEHGPPDAPAVVLLHSSGMHSGQWRAYLDPLAALGWRSLAVDLYGYGHSPAWQGPGPFDYRTDVAQVTALMRGLTARPFAIVGHSYGALVGLLAMLEPGVTPTTAVLFEPVAWATLRDAPDGAIRARLDAMFDDDFLDDATGGTEPWMRRFVEFWSGPGAWEAIGPRGRAGMMRAGRKTFEEVRSLTADATRLATYRTLRAPLHLITGERSPVESRTVGRLLAGARPDNTLTQIPGGHMAPVTSPEACVPVVVSKLGTAPTAQ